MKHDKALFMTIKKMVPAVLIAMISTGLGLLSLYRSKVPMINDFGAMLTLGIVIAFMIGIFIFIPFLYIRDKHFPKEEKLKMSKKVKPNLFISNFVGGVLKFKFVILSLAIVLAIVGIYVDQSAEAETNLENFMPQDSEALADIKTLRNIIGSTEQIAIIIEDTYILSLENLESIRDVENLLITKYEENIIETSSLLSLLEMMGLGNLEMINETTLQGMPIDQRKLFINESYTKTVINVSIVEMSDEQFSSFINNLEKDINLINKDSKISITGQSVIDIEMMNALTTGRYEITMIGLVLIFISLLVIYRSFYRAILPIIPIVIIVGWSGGIMALFGISYTPLTATLGALIMGIGTEFTILISERFEEEKLKTDNRQEAIKNTFSRMANPILVSALTTMGGFSALIFSDFVILSNFGIMTLVNLSLALLSTIVVLPTILAITFTRKLRY
ncbi:hydrophobe/amphiphile efflux-3 (HAE3) family protein [Acholeplasma morum]|uniref:efflux RND transporter permease subunit n=1 Tax=Paracholeplasma morum TaxID=264637 RepID=UPI00195C337E|nr:MMPL family transporter [Paracholeplasma morum]MBM7453180.1 hydrophobe/amphiphile efflux-3 (HAE3) family protein [Paracholeplasma morum]